MKGSLLFASFFCLFATHAQESKSGHVSAPYSKEDTLISNVSKAIKKVISIATNPKSTQEDYTGDYLFIKHGEPFFSSKIELNGSENVYVSKSGTRRNEGITEWRWQSTIVSAKTNTLTATILQTKKSLDSLIKNISIPNNSGKQHHVSNIYTTLWLADSMKWRMSDNDSLVLTVEFFKPLSGTVEETIDSLSKDYWPRMLDARTAGEASNSFSEQMSKEDIPIQQQQMEYTKIMKNVGSIDPYAAFLVIMKAGYQLDINQMMAPLEPGLRSKIKEYATKIVNDYNSQYSSTTSSTPPPSGDTRVNAPDKCQDNLRRQLYAVNTFLISKGFAKDEARVVSFNCYNNTYVVESREFIPAKKTFFQNNKSVSRYILSSFVKTGQQINNDYDRSEKKYTVCPVCHGTGVVSQNTATHDDYNWHRIGNTDSYILKNDAINFSVLNKCLKCSGDGWF
ncbi:MAG: hypothetical protein ABIP30_07860 [Ferruginibacter sp.]